LDLDAYIPDHSTFSRNRHSRFRESDLLRKLFETVVARCIKEGVVGGEAVAVDASMIVADAHRRRGVAKVEDLDPTFSRAVAEYLSVLDDTACGGATPTEPKAIWPTDPADPNSAEVLLAIQDVLSPAIGKREDCFKSLDKDALKRILKNRFDALISDREKQCAVAAIAASGIGPSISVAIGARASSPTLPTSS
jgi:hypothetical protein